MEVVQLDMIVTQYLIVLFVIKSLDVRHVTQDIQILQLFYAKLYVEMASLLLLNNATMEI